MVIRRFGIGFQMSKELRLKGILFWRSWIWTEEKADDEKDEFYGNLEDAYVRLNKHTIRIVLGDANVNVGRVTYVQICTWANKHQLITTMGKYL